MRDEVLLMLETPERFAEALATAVQRFLALLHGERRLERDSLS